jgi:hypothetical protein
MVKRKDIFNDSGDVWDDRIQKYRRNTWCDLVPPKRWFDWNIAPRCVAGGYQKSGKFAGFEDVDAFVYFLEWYFPKEASQKIFDMAFWSEREVRECENARENARKWSAL